MEKEIEIKLISFGKACELLECSPLELRAFVQDGFVRQATLHDCKRFLQHEIVFLAEAFALSGAV